LISTEREIASTRPSHPGRVHHTDPVTATMGLMHDGMVVRSAIARRNGVREESAAGFDLPSQMTHFLGCFRPNLKSGDRAVAAACRIIRSVGPVTTPIAITPALVRAVSGQSEHGRMVLLARVAPCRSHKPQVARPARPTAESDRSGYPGSARKRGGNNPNR
jgi:hypothetical protein